MSKAATIALNKSSAKKARFVGDGEIVAIKDVTDDYPVDLFRVRNALIKSEFDQYEIEFICQVLAGCLR